MEEVLLQLQTSTKVTPLIPLRPHSKELLTKPFALLSCKISSKNLTTMSN